MRHSRVYALYLFILYLSSVASYARLPAIALETHIADVGGDVFALNVPQGYQLELLTTDMQSPRMFIFDRAGNLLAGSRSGHVYRLEPPYDRPEPLLILPDYPHSLAIRGEYLYIAQTSSLSRIAYTAGDVLLDEGDLEEVISIPGGWGHNSRTVKVGPDNRIYLSLGITGNCSDEYLDNSYAQNDRRGGVMVLDETVQPVKWKTWANGLRNPVGFDWHPRSHVMYASNNGPDHLGYEQPPEYFSRLEQDSFHGMPWFWYDGKRIHRDTCISGTPPEEDIVPPVAIFPARNAPMDVHFIRHGELAEKFSHDAIVALRGSWGTKPHGASTGDPASRRPPKLVLVRFNKHKVIRVDDLVTGFQNVKGARIARPVGLGIGPDGVLYFTSDGGINGLFRLLARTE